MADPWAEFEEVHPATAALSRLEGRGAKVTNGYRTPEDVERLKREGYTPAEDGAHNRGDGVDLVPGGQFKSLGQLRVMAAREFGNGATVQIHNGTHVHVAIPGWHDAPDTTRANAWDEFNEVAPKTAARVKSQLAPSSPPASSHPSASPTGDVHDGDTFRLSTGDNARLYGVDAFELNQRGLSPHGDFVPLGTEGRDFLSSHLPSGPVDFTGQSTYGRPVVDGGSASVGLVRNGLGLAEPDYLKGDPHLPEYMEAERLARLNGLGAHGNTYQTPSSFRHGNPDPWAKPEASTDGKGDAVFWDDPTPFQGLRPEIAKGYLGIWMDMNSKPEDLLNYAKENGFTIGEAETRKAYARREKSGHPTPTISYEHPPRLLTNVGDGATGAAVRGFGDPINMLDELGGVADTVLPVPDFDGPRENVYNSDRRFGDILWNNIDQNRAILEYDDEKHPYARFGGQAASALVAPAFGVEGVAARATTKALESGMSRFAAEEVGKRAVARRLAAIGGGEGAVAGAGGGEGIKGRAEGAVIGGIGGAVAAPILGKAVEGAVSLGKKGYAALDRFRNRETAAAAGDIPEAAVDVGPHGPIHYDLADDYPAAVARLKADQTGEIPGAITHPEIGDIDLVWGDGRYGLSHILKDHPEVADNLPEIVEGLPVKQRPEDTGNNRFVLENDTHRAVISPDFDGVDKRWLVTAFERKRPAGAEEGPGAQTSRREPLSPDGGSTGADGSNIGSSDRYANMDAETGPSVESEPLPSAPGRAGNLTDAEMGRGGLHDSGPQPEDFAPAADRMSPEDVVPIPGNRVESMEEAERANPGSLRDIEAPDDLAELHVRTIQTRNGRSVKYRGPLDAVAYLRLKGGLKSSRGELRHMGITDNRPRPSNRQEWRLGPILNSKDGMSVDDAGELLWDAGYFNERPTEAEVLDVIRNGYDGQPLHHPESINEILRFEDAQAERGRVESADPPLAEERGSPATFEDMEANRPPATAYEDLPGLVDKVGNINLRNISNAGDIGRAMKRLEDEFGMGAKSPVSHAETEALAREMGMSAKDLLASREGRAFNHAEATAARALLSKSYHEMLQLARKAQNGSDEDKLLFSKAVANVAAIHNKVSGLTREAGRALSAFRIPVDQKTLRGKALKELLEAHGGADNLENLAGHILDMERDGKTPGGIVRYATDVVKPKWSDKALALWMFALLSGPKTHAVNIISNTLTALGQLPEHAVAAGLGNVRRLAGARATRAGLRMPQVDDRVLMSELGPRAFGLLQGAKEGLLNAKTALKTGETSDSVTKLEMSRQQEAFSGIAGHIIHAPTRLLSAEDEFFKSIARRMEVNALAVRKARSEGLRGEALQERISDLSAHPTEDMTDKAFDYARYLTFQRPLGEKGQAFMNLVGKAKLMRIPLPFVRTPTNLLKFAVERSPAAPILREVREDFKAGGSRRDLAIAKMMLGSGFGLAISEMASNGFVTGSGPADDNAVRLLRADGWQPYSLKIGDKYVSYQRLDPLATTMGVFADFVDLQSAMTDKQREEIGTLLTASIIQNLGNKTWLSGLADAFEVYSDPQRRSGPYINRLVGSTVPAAVAQTAQVLDPTIRQAKTRMDAIRARVPGMSQTLLPKRDIFGREITREGGIGPDIISPFPTGTRKHDPVVNAVLESGAHIDVPDRKVRGKPLSDTDFDRYQQLAGKYLYSDMADAVRDPEWKSLNADERRTEIESMKKSAREDARYDLFGDDTEE